MKKAGIVIIAVLVVLLGISFGFNHKQNAECSNARRYLLNQHNELQTIDNFYTPESSANVQDDPMEEQTGEARTLLLQSSIPLDTAAYYFERVYEIWNEDGGRLWGFPLHAPLMFSDTVTRHTVTNMPDLRGLLQKNGDVYEGWLPDDVVIWGSSRI